MSAIRVYLAPGDTTSYQDVAEGYSMLIGDDDVLEVYDEDDQILGLFKTWDRAVNLPPEPGDSRFGPRPVLVAAPVEDPEADDEDDEELDDDGTLGS